MKSIKIVTFEKDELVENLNQKAIDIAIDILLIEEFRVDDLHNYGWSKYDKNTMNIAISLIKKKHLAYYKGQANMLLQFIVEFDVYINKNANNFLKHLNSL